MYPICWRWELTPKEALSSYTYIPASKTEHLTLDERPFRGPRRALLNTEYTYQLALSARSRSVDIQAISGHHPEIPFSGDERSGVLVYHGEKIIGSLTLPGKVSGYSLYVRPEYRDQHLAFRMLLEWCSQTKRPRVITHQQLTLVSAKALLAPHKALVERALAEGKPVPERVVQAVAAGEEAASILRQAAA